MIILYVTCKDKGEAEKISEYLLNKKLVACTNYFPMNSMYWWNNKLTKDKEYVLLIKTLGKNKSIVKKEIKNIHSYEIPCILEFKVDANKEYEKWAKSEIK